MPERVATYPERFHAFSFVDRIVAWTPGRAARGRYTIPAHLAAFPQSLVAEAVGQLAAWVSMQHIDYRGRPVAGIAAETLFHGVASPGQTLDLEIAIDSCDDEAVSYDGHARIDGASVLDLNHCVGPMLPMTDFDDPAAVRADFGRLTTAGREPGAFRGVPAFDVETTSHEPGRTLAARLSVPRNAPFFGDHFPRRAVFPGTLLLDTQMRLALALANETTPVESHPALRPRRVTNVKIRSFIEPGTNVDLEARVRDGLTYDLAARIEGRNVAVARVELAQ
jgi:3-hydroxymyristoyl/3-hydroxydecanoyl-(acyl carrier protein) dehydratase